MSKRTKAEGRTQWNGRLIPYTLKQIQFLKGLYGMSEARVVAFALERLFQQVRAEPDFLQAEASEWPAQEERIEQGYRESPG